MAGNKDNRNPARSSILAGHTDPPSTPPTDPRQVDLELQRAKAAAAESAAANPAAQSTGKVKQEFEIHSGFAKSKLESAIRIYNAALNYVLLHNTNDIDDLRDAGVLIKKIKDATGLRVGQVVYQYDPEKAAAWIAANPKEKSAGSSGKSAKKLGYELGSHDLGIAKREYVIASKITRSLIGGNLNIVAENVMAIVDTKFETCVIHKIVDGEVMLAEIKLRISTAGAEFPKERFDAKGILIAAKKSSKESTRAKADVVYVAEFMIVGAGGNIESAKLVEWGKRNLLDSIMRRYDKIVVVAQIAPTVEPAPEAIVIDQPAQ